MTDKEYLALLEQGVEHWNRWRAENPNVKPDFSRAYLFELDLSGADLNSVTLNRACLIGANLTGANLAGADLTGVYASGANLQDANLTGADLTGASLNEANLTRANLTDAQAGGVNFTQALLTGVCLERCAINDATQLDEVDCEFVYLQGPDQERYPESGRFGGEEFARWFQARPQVTPRQSSVSRPDATTGTNSQPVAATTQLYDRPSARSSGAVQSGAVQSVPRVAPAVANQSLPQGLGALSDRPKSLLLLGLGGVGLLLLLLLVMLRGRSPEPVPNVSRPGPEIVSLPAMPCDTEPPPPPLPNRSPDHEYSTGARYYGEFVNGLPADGRGIMVFSSGARYDGEYRDGRRNGCGTFTFAGGQVYVGQFRDDRFEGQGIWTFANGDRYIGGFSANKCSGSGTFISLDGSSQSGIWQNGELLGGSLSCDR